MPYKFGDPRPVYRDNALLRTADKNQRRGMFAGNALSAPKRTLGDLVRDKASNALAPVAGKRMARKLADLIDYSPVGNVAQGFDAGQMFGQGDLLGGGLGALLAVAPMPGPGKKFIAKVFHASPASGLERILATPPTHQFDNATSQLGAFFAPTRSGAERYGNNVYETNLTLRNPYEMDWNEFNYFQSPHKNADGSSAQDWAARADELKQEAAILRRKLEQAGHDGVVVRGRRGPVEIASFADVPLK